MPKGSHKKWRFDTSRSTQIANEDSKMEGKYLCDTPLKISLTWDEMGM